MEVIDLKHVILSAVALITLASSAVATDSLTDYIAGVAGPSKATFYAPLIQEKAHKYGVPPLVVAKMIYFESHFNPRTRSPYGYMGLMQLSPGHARRGENLLDPGTNIEAGCRLLASYHRRLGGGWHRALSAYSHGPGMVASRGLYRTRYSRKILGNSNP